MRKMLPVLFLVVPALIFSVAGLNAGQPEKPEVSFKADFVMIEGGETMVTGRYYASPDGLRLEGVQEGESWIMIVNFEQGVVLNVMEEEKIYLATPFIFEDTEVTTEDVFGGFAFGNPCPGEGTESRLLDRETLHGRAVEKWECRLPDGDEVTVWYDGRLQGGIRVSDGDGVFELNNIEEVQIPHDLFEPPPGYQRMQF